MCGCGNIKKATDNPNKQKQLKMIRKLWEKSKLVNKQTIVKKIK